MRTDEHPRVGGFNALRVFVPVASSEEVDAASFSVDDVDVPPFTAIGVDADEGGKSVGLDCVPYRCCCVNVNGGADDAIVVVAGGDDDGDAASILALVFVVL